MQGQIVQDRKVWGRIVQGRIIRVPPRSWAGKGQVVSTRGEQERVNGTAGKGGVKRKTRRKMGMSVWEMVGLKRIAGKGIGGKVAEERCTVRFGKKSNTVTREKSIRLI
jgi:hypothetical protein